jgi:hypothetical protein
MKFKRGMKLWVPGVYVNPSPNVEDSHFHPMVRAQSGYEIKLKHIELDTNPVTCSKCGHTDRPVIWLARLLDEPKGSKRLRISEQYMINAGAERVR